jgi:Ataxin-3
LYLDRRRNFFRHRETPATMSVFHEKQQAGLCAVHALNAALQGAYFTAVDLAQIAREFDELERQAMLEAGADTPEAIRFLAEDSSNVAGDGNFSVQVLERALASFSVQLERVRPNTPTGRELLRTAATTQRAFIANQGEHWLTLRKIDVGTESLWFNLNSLEDAPQSMSHLYVDAYLTSLGEQGYDLFLVRGELPPASQSLEGGGAWFSVVCENDSSPPLIFDHLGNAVTATKAKARSKSKRTQRASSSESDDDSDDDLKRAIAESKRSAPVPKQRIVETVRLDDDDDDDEALKAALALSMQDSLR